jgi:hypothetical protein
LSGATQFEQALVLLARHGVEFIVVGGVAAVAHGAPIVTLDLDVVHRRTPDNVLRLLRAIEDLGGTYIRDRRNLSPQESHLVSPGHQLLDTRLGRIDFLGQLGEGLDYETLAAEGVLIELFGIPTRIIALDRLIAIKQSLGRPKDKLMLLQLLALRAERERKP